MENLKKEFFFHSDNYAHIIDKIVSKISFHYSDFVLFDSEKTMAAYQTNKQKFIIPFNFKRSNKLYTEKLDPSFVYVGRINKVKGIDRAIDLFSYINKKIPDAKFDIFGPDEGELNNLNHKVSSLGMKNNITFYPSISYEMVDSILVNYTFYLQLSHREGLAASVMQAQSMGLIPIVTPVGEIPFYCHDEYNSIIVNHTSSYEKKSQVISLLLKDTSILLKMKKNAIDTVKEYPSYDDKFIEMLTTIS